MPALSTASKQILGYSLVGRMNPKNYTKLPE